jgi:predicted CxxxxCH...CXXCH cytochrome family protein
MYMRRVALAVAAGLLLLAGCGGGENEGSSNTIPAGSAAYIVVAWNDLGMHCLNPSYDTAVILPPYNTVWAQVIKRANPPQIVTSGLTVSYRIINNTTSANKGLFGQFWTNALKLFGKTPATNFGLNLVDPLISNGLSGTMVAKGDHFQVNGIPVVPVEDNGIKNPYQVAEITVKDASGTIVAQTRATVPTSDEINCGKCHPGATVTDVFNNVLSKHDANIGTTLSSQKPVLCASCHGSPALNAPLKPKAGGGMISYLSYAIHNSHAGRGAGCYDCHPGATTKCNRSTKHTNNNAADGNCANISCHGSMTNVASTITSGRIPWENEPKCVTCHSGVAQVDTGTVLYRNAIGHGGVYCAGCHGSPHAMVPSNQASDNYQALQYQAKAMVLGDCRNCHGSSRGGGNNFAGEHGNSKQSACNVCHTGFQNSGNTANWPHQFQWKSR